MDISPLKLHEYLATGRPVVASDIDAIRPFHDAAALAPSVPEWDAAIAGALAGRGPGTAQSRRRTAEKYDWDIINARLDAALLRALGARG